MAAILDFGQAGSRSKVLPGPVGIIGAGKVGTALAALLHARGVDIAGVSGRTLDDTRRMAQAARLEASAALDRARTLAMSKIVFLTVPDDAIGALCKEIADGEGWRAGQGVVHCSGALPSDVLQPARDAGALAASFHPLQAFASLDAALTHMPGSTFALEGDDELVAQLEVFVDLLNGTPLRLRAEEKTVYHAAAAIASNYTVTLAALASNLLVRRGIAPDANTALYYLMPLLKGTVDNLDALGLPAALTGPLVRGDTGTVAHHLAALEECCASELAHLYRHLARLTLPMARQKGHLDEATIEQLEELLQERNDKDKNLITIEIPQAVEGVTKDDLRRLTNEMVDTMLSMIADCTDADVTHEPADPEADDPVAASDDEVKLPWTLGHVIVHTTASAEESAALAAELARGVEWHGRSRSEVPWRTVTSIEQCRQRLEESRRMRLASLDMWPDHPHLDNTYTPREGVPPINATRRFLNGLRHDQSHVEHIARLVEEARSVKRET